MLKTNAKKSTMHIFRTFICSL